MILKKEYEKKENNFMLHKQVIPVLLILLLVGCSVGVKKGDKVRVHYTGSLEDGSVFDSSEGKDPLEFTAGAGQMIKGFDSAVIGMEVGEEKEVKIPPEEAYSSGPLGGKTLIFKIRLVSIG